MTERSYDADYFLRGKELGISGYTDYRWMPDLTIPMAQVIIDHCGIDKKDKILDFGCARGYVVKAFRRLGHEAYGVDVSQWAVENGDEEIKQHLVHAPDGSLPDTRFDWVIAKDVLEHIPYVSYVITRLMNAASKGVFAVVPLSHFDNSKYVVDEYEKDVTHIQRKTIGTWIEMFMRHGWSVEASFRIAGIKDNYYKPGWEQANGFITARRIKE